MADDEPGLRPATSASRRLRRRRSVCGLGERPERMPQPPTEGFCFTNTGASSELLLRESLAMVSIDGTSLRLLRSDRQRARIPDVGRQPHRARDVAERLRGRRDLLERRRPRAVQLARADDRRPRQAGHRRPGGGHVGDLRSVHRLRRRPASPARRRRRRTSPAPPRLWKGIEPARVERRDPEHWLEDDALDLGPTGRGLELRARASCTCRRRRRTSTQRADCRRSDGVPRRRIGQPRGIHDDVLCGSTAPTPAATARRRRRWTLGATRDFQIASRVRSPSLDAGHRRTTIAWSPRNFFGTTGTVTHETQRTKLRISTPVAVIGQPPWST